MKITANHGRYGKLVKGSRVVIRDAVIDLSADVIVGDDSEIYDRVRIYTHKHCWNHSRDLRKDCQQILYVRLEIGQDVFIGDGAIILAVSSIGDGAVIGAGSVVTHNVPAYEVWAGNPARKVGERKDSDGRT